MKSGFFVSCKKGKEEKAFKELQTVLNTSFDTIETQPDYSTLNVSEEIKNEIRILKKSFFSLFFTYKSMFYVSNSSPFTPSKLFYILKERGVKLEYVHRIVPLDRFTTYNENVMRKGLVDIDKSLTFKIEYEERFVPQDTRKRIFELITSTLEGMKVDLSRPDYLIIVSALKNDVGFTVLKNNKEHFNFSKTNKEV
ncbi:putative tRNA acetlytransferase [Vairimorpha necatrix]|uniref:tRNA acetlytransferase n=1 Tax=Vairimorpha necatrix TaxID=6039 RepID=A0AAX4J8B8_9MICR